MAKSTPSKAALSKADNTLASDGSPKGAESKADGSTPLGKVLTAGVPADASRRDHRHRPSPNGACRATAGRSAALRIVTLYDPTKARTQSIKGT